MKTIKLLLLSIFALTVQYTTAAEEVQKAASEDLIGSHFLILVGAQEANGKRGFHLTYDKPKKAINKSTLEIAGYNVDVEQYSFEAGMQTILYRFKASKENAKREINVLYSGMLSFTAGTSGGDGYYFYVAEEYEKTIRYHAIYINEPSIEQLKAVVEKALMNPDSALVATRWAGKESEVFIYDSSRLKK